MGDSVDCFYVLGRDHPDTVIEPSITSPSLSFRRLLYHIPMPVESVERTIPLSGETASWHKRQCCKASSCLLGCWENLSLGEAHNGDGKQQ